MAEVKLEQPIKVAILGAEKVGKTTLMAQWVAHFTEAHQPSFCTREISFKQDGLPVACSISDSLSLIDLTQKSTDAQNIDLAFLVCDLTRPDTLHCLKDYIEAVRGLNPKCQFILLANKCDLPNNLLVVNSQDVEQFAKEHGEFQYFLCGAHNDFNIRYPFLEGVKLVVAKPELSKVTEEAETQTNSESFEQKKVLTATPKPKKSCATSFWKICKVMAHPALTTIGIVLLLAGIAVLLAATYGVGGVALAGVLTIGGSTAAGVGGVSTLLSAIGFCKNRCASRAKDDVQAAPPRLSA